MSKAIIFKFGGASVKDAPAVKNLADIMGNRLQNPVVIVVSAMGKSTNLLEEIIQKKIGAKDFSSNITNLKNMHLDICRELFPEEHQVFAAIDNLFVRMERDLSHHIDDDGHEELYDQIVCYGEILSTKIVQAYLCQQEIYCLWQDARELIITDERFCAAWVDWELTRKNCRQILLPQIEKYPVVTQGFIGRSITGKNTTLGREGSDFTAAILAHCLEAKGVTIWKDVPGVLNADPKEFTNTILFPRLDYREAAEMTFYGASVIHPKTIKPLANRNIPLYVKSFLDPSAPGTLISNSGEFQTIPSFVLKRAQVLVTFRVTDFTFINEFHLHQIYAVLEKLKIRVNLMQTSAISISLCLDRQFMKIEKLAKELESLFAIKYNENLELLTILHHQQEVVQEIEEGKEILLEQRTRNNYHIVYRPLNQEDD